MTTPRPHRRRSPRRGWRRAVPLVALALVAGALAATGGPATLDAGPAAAAGDELKPRFADPNRVTLLDTPVPVAYLGAGSGTGWYQVISEEGLAASEFGFDADATDPLALRGTTAYPDGGGFAAITAAGETVVDMELGEVRRPTAEPQAEDRVDIYAVVRAVDPGGDGSVWVVGPQDEGYPHAAKAYDGGTTGLRVGDVAFLNERLGTKQVGGATVAASTIVLAAGTELRTLQVHQAADGTPLLALPPTDASAARSRPILAVTHRSAWDVLPGSTFDLLPPLSTATDGRFLTAEADALAGGEEYRPQIVEHVVRPDGSFAEANVMTDGAAPTGVRMSAAEAASGRADLRYEPFLTGNSQIGYTMAFLAPNGSAAVATRARVAGSQVRRWTQDALWCGRGFDMRSFHGPGAPNGQGVSDPDLSGQDGRWRMVCASPAGGTGAAARMEAISYRGTGVNIANMDNVGFSQGIIGDSRGVDLGEGDTKGVGAAPGHVFVDPEVHVELPCLKLIEQNGAFDGVDFVGDDCSVTATSLYDPDEDDPQPPNGNEYWIEDPGNAAFTVLAGESPSASGTRVDAPVRSLHHASDEVSPGLAGVIGRKWRQELAPDGPEGDLRTLARQPSGNQVIVLDLHPEFDGCRQSLAPTACAAESIQKEPVPIAVMAAPPQVANSGQEAFASPVFATSRTTSQGEATTVGGSAGVNIGGKIEHQLFPGLKFEVEMKATYDFASGITTGSTLDLTSTESFVGLEYDDSVVYQSVTAWRVRGDIAYSSSGIAAGDELTIDQPRFVDRNIASWTALQRQFPEVFAPRPGGAPNLNAGMERLLDHEVGNPGSYPSFAGGVEGLKAPDDGGCLGTVDEDGRTDAERLGSGFDISLAGNRFVERNAPSTDMSVLTSPQRQVAAGSASSVGAGIEITTTDSKTYNEEHQVGFEFQATIAAVTGGFSLAQSYANELSFAVSEGTGFEAYVSNFPDERMADETYSWRMYLCKVDVGTASGLGAPLPVSYLGFTVDGYSDDASGGFEALGDVEPVAPVESQRTSRTPTLSFDHEEGSVVRYDAQVEAVGVRDVRTLTREWDRPDPDRPDRIDMAVPADEPLLPGQLHRWRVTATDHLDETTRSDWAYFVTAGTPAIVGQVTSDADGEPVAGICSYLFRPGGEWVAQGGCSDDTGQYVIAPPGAGTYRVALYDPAGLHHTTWHGGTDLASGDDVVVTGQGAVTGVDAWLREVTSVTGRILTPVGGEPIEGVCAYLYRLDGTYAGAGDCTDADGRYVIQQPVPGDHQLVVSDPAGIRLTTWMGPDGEPRQGQTGAAVVTVAEDRITANPDLRMATPTTVTGRVTDADGTPMAGACAYLFDAGTQAYRGGSCTDSEGRYVAQPSDGQGGDLLVAVVDPSGVNLTTWYRDQGVAVPTVADALPVTVGQTEVASGIDVRMLRFRTIMGKVSDAGGAPVADTCAYLFRPDGSYAGHGACTGADGRYVLQDMSAGTYRVAIVDPQARYRTTWVGGADQASAQDVVIAVPQGSTVTGLDATVAALGSVSGIVSAPDGGPLEGACTYLNRSDGTYAGLGACTGSDGSYSIVGVPPGDYRVAFYGPSTPVPSDTWWDGASSEATADVLTVEDGEAVTGIDGRIPPSGIA